MSQFLRVFLPTLEISRVDYALQLLALTFCKPTLGKTTNIHCLIDIFGSALRPLRAKVDNLVQSGS